MQYAGVQSRVVTSVQWYAAATAAPGCAGGQQWQRLVVLKGSNGNGLQYKWGQPALVTTDMQAVAGSATALAWQTQLQS
jgi:hypothetical protein